MDTHLHQFRSKTKSRSQPDSPAAEDDLRERGRKPGSERSGQGARECRSADNGTVSVPAKASKCNWTGRKQGGIEELIDLKHLFNIRHSPLKRWSTDAKRPEVRDSASNAPMEILGGDLATLMLGQPVTFPLRREPVSQLSRHLWSPIISQLPSLLPYQPNMLLLTRPC